MARRSKTKASRKPRSGNGVNVLPSREDVLAFINSRQDNVGKKEIARAFKLKGQARAELKDLLNEMLEEGLITGNKKALHPPSILPNVTLLRVIAHDQHGDLIGEPVSWEDNVARPRVLFLDDSGAPSTSQLSVGDQVLARITQIEEDTEHEHDVDQQSEASDQVAYTATVIKKLSRERRKLLGIFRRHQKGGGTIEPVDRKTLKSWTVKSGDHRDADDGDLVYFELSRQGRFKLPIARIIESLGNPQEQKQISLIAVHAHGLPCEFPNRVLAETESLGPASNKKRDDLTKLPLITIDPEDARDHDDAVHARPDTDPANASGFIVTVAIADVAHYVSVGSYLDREALKRGNSVYFPDRVVPMLPERISNDLCSLRENEVRPCLAVEMVFNSNGEKRRHRFLRALMKSAAKLSYQEAQAAIDGRPSEKCQPLLDPVLKPLWQAYGTLSAARNKRSPLALDLSERRIKLNRKGQVAGIDVPERLTAHKLIEEFMIQANVAAAETLEEKKMRLIYRAHDKPAKEKLKALRDFLATLDMTLPSGDKLRPSAFNGILRRAEKLPIRDLINEVILRAQAQAEYTPENCGHFGLNLNRYAHFTSPIRRYADLVVHRLLIGALEFGDDGYEKNHPTNLGDIASSISQAERRAMTAERETIDRLTAAYLAEKVGATFRGRISGLTRSGLFIRLDETGADGFVPMSSLDDDFYHHVEEAWALVGQRTSRAYRLGDTVEVRLLEALPMAGALRFEMLTPGTKGQISLPRGAVKQKGRFRQRHKHAGKKHRRSAKRSRG